MKCPLCGYNAVNPDHCTTCPVAGKSCSVAKCPNCGYAFAPDSSLVKLIRKIFRSKPPMDKTFVNK